VMIDTESCAVASTVWRAACPDILSMHRTAQQLHCRGGVAGTFCVPLLLIPDAMTAGTQLASQCMCHHGPHVLQAFKGALAVSCPLQALRHLAAGIEDTTVPHCPRRCTWCCTACDTVSCPQGRTD
jgi:hypothetical protein